MFLLLAQDGAKPAEAADAAKTPTTSPLDVSHAANELLNDPTKTMSRWADKSWDLIKTHGPGILSALILLFVAYMIAKWVRRIVIRACTAAKIDLTLSKFFGNLAKWAIILFSIVTAAGTVGISTTGFAAAIGAAGLAVGLALQGNLGNLAAGVLLLIFRPFKVGDSVIVAGQTGIVDGIDLFTTNLDTGDNRRLIVPNGAIFGGTIENQSHHPMRRIDYNVTVAGSQDIDRVRVLFGKVLANIVASGEGALSTPAPTVALAEITPNQVWTLNLWASTPKAAAVRERLLIEVRQAVGEAALSPPAAVQLVKQVV
jgi:small conductance mechanosensitive channel